jgi:hypothetical protein
MKRIIRMPRELTRYFSTAGEVNDANRSDMPLPEQQVLFEERELMRAEQLRDHQRNES